jgi:hypothetical protein
MAQEVADGTNDLEQLKRRFEEFRSVQKLRGRLPESLWKEAAEAARRYGLNPTTRALRLDYNRLKERLVAAPGAAKQKKQVSPTPAFVQLIGPAANTTTECHIEVESEQGAKLGLEVKSVAAGELAGLIRAFLGQ